MARTPGINKSKTNDQAIEDACREFRKRLVAELSFDPNMHGSVSVVTQISGGVIDRFRVAVEGNQKCEAVTA